MTYLTAIERTHDNPLTGSAQYRVVDCCQSFGHGRKKVFDIGWMKRNWNIVTDRPYRTGTFINPKKALGI